MQLHTREQGRDHRTALTCEDRPPLSLLAQTARLPAA